jgi:hypothetical protein
MKNQNPNFPEETQLSDTDLLRSRIEPRAHELYEARGCLEGFDLQDWLQAERALRQVRKSMKNEIMGPDL